MAAAPVLFHYADLVVRWGLRLSPEFRACFEARVAAHARLDGGRGSGPGTRRVGPSWS
jgi:hypothetical protein